VHKPAVEYLPCVPDLWLSPLLTFFFAFLPKRQRQKQIIRSEKNSSTLSLRQPNISAVWYDMDWK
jgi:hypothetical protein